MPIIERPEFPRKQKLQGTMLLLAALALVFGIAYQKISNSKQRRNIIIYSVSFEDYDRQFIRLAYDIENKGKNDAQITLLGKVFDDRNEEIASIIFTTDVKASSREYQTKIIDKLNRPLKKDEKPYRATLQLIQRGLFSYE